MGRHRKRSCSRSSSSSSNSDKHNRHIKRRHKKQIQRRDLRIGALEELVKELRKDFNYHGTNTRSQSNISSNSATAPTSQLACTAVSSANTQMPTVVRYVGRSDFIPEFDPQNTNISVEHWIRNLEAIGKMHGWDERTLICNCTSKLMGYAKDWYERQSCYEVGWPEWKTKLIKAFPFTKNKLSQIRELVNRVKLPKEDPIKFYYEKLGIGMSCDMTDEVITEAIIGTLGDKLLEVGAVSAGCHDSATLLKYLANVKTSSIPFGEDSGKTLKETVPKPHKLKCFSCGQLGHKAGTCKTRRKQEMFCKICNRRGHTEAACFRRKENTTKCSYCYIKGHTFEECRKRPNQKSKQDKSIKNVQMVCPDISDKKYFKTVQVNGISCKAFLDFGSSCNTIRKSFSEQLKLQPRPNDLVVIKGFGDGLTVPLGLVTATLIVDGVQRHCEFYLVPDDAQEFEILVGQPFTEADNIVVVKTSSHLNIFDGELSPGLLDLCEDISKVMLFPNSECSLSPGLNKVAVRSEPFVEGALQLTLSEHRAPSLEKDIPAQVIDSSDGHALIKVINKTNNVIQFKEKDCIARANVVESQPKWSIDSPNCGAHLSDQHKESLKQLLNQFEHCFSGNGVELGNCSIEMTIKLTDDKVINYKPYRMSYHEREIIRETVAELLAAGIIEDSRSPYASPVILVRKKDGGYRMCVDYRALNKITEKERYPLPVIQDLLDRLVDKKVFCCLDLANGYHQIRIAQRSRPLTGFVTQDGHYQYRMMSFGLCNAPAVFQRAMHEILRPVLHECAEVYIDDVILWGEDERDCLQNLKRVFELIEGAGVKLKLNKCSFLTDAVEYLGHNIKAGEIRPSTSKVDAVKNFKTPCNVHEVRQFLGLASYFRKFVKGFATIARPLTQLTKKNIEWSWHEPQELAMQTLKEILISEPILTIFSPERETQLHTDASKAGLGAVLLQRVNGDLKVVAYASRQTTEAEEKYHSFELEALAVVFGIQKFKVYVTGLKFVVVSDCSALRLAWAKRDLSPRIARWWLDLQEFDFEVEHRPGTAMTHVDALSRNPISICHIEEKDLLLELQQGDEGIQTIIHNLKKEQTGDKQNGKGLSKDYKLVNDQLCRILDSGVVKPVLPKGARWHILKIYHDDHGHMGADKCLEALRAKYWFPKMRRFVEKYISSCIGCQFTKKPTGKQPGLLHPIPRKPVPFDTLHIDHLGPFCKSNGKTYIFAIIDGFTKFVWLEAVSAANAKGAIVALTNLSKVFGCPVRIVSDRGSAFTSREFKQFCERFGIKHVLNAVASPRANGQVERLNRTILSALTAQMGEERKGWDAYLPKVQLGINSTISQGSGKSPLELLCGLRPRLVGELQGPLGTIENVADLRSEAAECIEKNANRMSTRYNKQRRITESLPIGSLVMVERKILRKGLMSGKLVPRYAGPYRVTAALPHDRYKVTSAAKGKQAYTGIVARDKIKSWHTRDDTSDDE